MANTSLAEQLKKLQVPYTKTLAPKKHKPSLLFNPSEAASIDRSTFYEIGVSGLNELIDKNEAFEEFKFSLFDETSKNFERAVESREVNEKLDAVIKKFLYSLSPYFLLKPTQQVLEWLICRFHIHECNVDDLICIALPYHGTKLFARLIQVFDLKNSNKKWQWLYPIQKKGVPLSKSALFNHCASDVAFLKMICEVTVEAVEIYGSKASRLSTFFGFYSTTIIGAIQHMPEITEVHITYMLPSMYLGLSSDCVDFTASVLVIIASILAKVSFQKRTHCKLVERIAKIRHASLRASVILLLNILYQSLDENETDISPKAIKNMMNNDWFISSLSEFINSGSYPNVFYLLLMRDSLKIIREANADDEKIRTFIHSLLSSCRVDNNCAEKLIKFTIHEVKNNANDWSCELVQGLERQYPMAWDNVISAVFREYPSESLSRILGLTSVTSQVQMFEKLNHVNPVVRIEALKYISENPSSVKVKYVKESLIARWDDDDPIVVEAMFSLPKEMRFCSSEIIDRLLLKCWKQSGDEWNALLLRIVNELRTEFDLKTNAAKYTVLLFPFWVSSSANVQKCILNMELPFFKSISKIKSSSIKVLKKSILPSAEELIVAYEELPKESVYVVTFLLLFSSCYASPKEKNKSKILSFATKEVLESNFKKLKWREDDIWDDVRIEEYYNRTKKGKFPREVVHKFFVSIIESTPIPEHFSSTGWLDFTDEFSIVVSHLYKCITSCFSFNEEAKCNIFISLFIEKHFKPLYNRISFLCNICVQYKSDISVQNCTFRMINSLLKNTDEGYSWAMSLKLDNVLVPSILIFLYSKDSEIRSSVMDTVEIITTSLSSALVTELTYLDLLKYLLQYKTEIILDREQLLSVMFAFLSQDSSIQALLPVSVRCFTKTILESIIKHVTDTATPVSVSASLLAPLEFINDTSSIEKLAEYADRLVRSSDSHEYDASFVIQNVINKLHDNDMDLYQISNIRKFIEHIVENGSKIKICATDGGVCCVNALLLRKLADGIFDKLDNEMKKLILNSILKICSEGDNIDLISAANSFAKKIHLNCELVVSYLESMIKAASEKKVKRKSIEITPTILESQEWKCGIALMELIQNKRKIFNCNLILPVLFEVLQKCCEIDDQMAVEYAKQVCLSCALNCSQKLISEKRSDIEKLFNVELVVSCIRMSPNPQTHHHALLLLAHCATFAPNRVLHNIMAIFTFMGSSILRQDDAFSFQIISNILETIVPLLVKSKDDKNELSDASIISVLRVFASSIPDIPDHRRLPLLLKLIKILNNGDYLHVLVILSLECSAKCSVNNKAVSTKYIEVVQELCLLLPAEVLLACFQKLIMLVNALPHSIEEKQKIPFPYGNFIDLKKYTNRELCHFNSIMLNFISTILSNGKFISQVTSADKNESDLFENYFRGIIEHTLLYVKSISEYNSQTKNTKNASTKYWKVVTSQSLEILNKTNALLTNEAFLSVISDLLNHECLTVQRKTMEILNWRLQQIKEDETKEMFSADELIPLITPLMKVVDTISNNLSDDGFDLKLNQQIALITLKLITRHCNAFNHPDEFKKILLNLTDVINGTTQMNDHVLACLVLCIAELISSLKIHAIESLPKFIPAFLNLFGKFQDEEQSHNDVILLSMITALQKIIEIIPNFLSPYLETILFEVCHLTDKLHRNEASKQKKPEDMKQSNISNKLKLIRQKISSEIPPRVLIPATSSCFTKFCDDSNYSAIEYLMNVLAESFPNNGQVSVELISLFINILDFRCTSKVSIEIVNQIEDYVIDSLCKIVLKCSEATFKPFYNKLYEWGIITSRDGSKKNRLITYYKMLSKISEKLKSVFVIFASNFISNAAGLLDKNNISKCEGDEGKLYFPHDVEKTLSLVDSILTTLHNVFKYDTIKFLTKERFNLLITPLVDQIENVIGDYENRSEKIIIPCLSHFATATSDDFLWKQFSYSVLLKTRHISPEVRLTALEVICMFATQLGDNFLPFLPETVPFLAELLEDENEIVEKRTHKVVQKLEQVLDEPIQKYF